MENREKLERVQESSSALADDAARFEAMAAELAARGAKEKKKWWKA